MHKLLFVLLLLCLAQCGTFSPSPTSRPTRAPISSELAIQFALDALHTDNAYGRLLGAPTMLRGQVMSLADASALVNGKALADNSPLARRREKLVWLVVTRGKWLLHIPGGHGDPLNRTPTIMSKDVTVPDLWSALLFDAITGEVYEQGGVVESQRGVLERLPALTYPRRGQ